MHSSMLSNNVQKKKSFVDTPNIIRNKQAKGSPIPSCNSEAYLHCLVYCQLRHVSDGSDRSSTILP